VLILTNERRQIVVTVPRRPAIAYLPVMGLAVLDACETANGIAVTLATDVGVQRLEGSHHEIARLADVMQQVSVLAPLNDRDKLWLEDVTVGEATVRLGLNPGGLTRLLILHA
jgi:hypothetical protein